MSRENTASANVKMKGNDHAGSTSSNSIVSVIVPARNEGKMVDRALESLVAQTWPRERMEIIFVDGCSTDNTVERAREILSASKIRYQILRNPKQNPAAGLNLGIKSSLGDLIVRCDAHTVYSPNFIENAVRVLSSTGADFAGGHQVPRPIDLAGKVLAVFMESKIGTGGGAFRCPNYEGWADTAYMGVYRRSVFERAGIFEEDLYGSEDDSFHHLMLKKGMRIYLSRDIKSWYVPTGTLWHHTRRFFRYGRGKGKSLVRFRRLTPWRQFVPPAFTGYVLSLIPAVFFLPFSLLAAYLTPMCIYMVLVTASAFSSARRWGFAASLAAIPSFPLFHIAYGTGFITGFIEESTRKILRLISTQKGKK